MQEYMKSQQCLMTFLASELDDPNPIVCGKCSVCLGRVLLSASCSTELVDRAIKYLRRSEQIIESRKRWVSESLVQYCFSGNISKNLQAEEGRALSLWGDAGWGETI
jgi:ATP-dependent DNA helicase RecQ